MKTKNLGHLMLDLETMGSKSNSAIVAIAAVEFDINTGETGKTFNNVVNLQSCLDKGMLVDGSTIMWWLSQSDNARKEIVNEYDSTIEQALYNFNHFIATLNAKTIQIWGNGARFDIGILEDAYTACKMEVPWNFRNERDVRTLVSFAPEIKEQCPYNGIRHNAIDDCKYQIEYCTKIWNKLNNK